MCFVDKSSVYFPLLVPKYSGETSDKSLHHRVETFELVNKKKFAKLIDSKTSVLFLLSFASQECCRALRPCNERNIQAINLV